ncbi:L-serine ammonia-lyase, iron-sulfur-dependent subunit beta [Enterococcus hirae]|nr:L-serine ammonia-lyase, iron-sulfur-dependent subunit beta [Enterococcus hirae]
MTDLRYRSVFDIIGPVMVGPSSSHTAGAARIGKIVRTIFGEKPEKVDIYLYESFAKTYRGHGTDIALVGGLLGMDPDDPNLANSLKLAYEEGIEIAFIPSNEKKEHPNSVRLLLSAGKKKMSITGISIGGGNIQISEVDGFKVNLTMGVPTILIVHQDVPGMIAQVTNVLSRHNINIGTMTVTRSAKGNEAIMIIEIDERDVAEVLPELRKIPHLHSANFFD